MRRVTARILASPRLKAQGGNRRRLGALQSAAEFAGHPPKGGLAMGAIGDVVPPRVVAQDRERVPLVQPLSVEAGDQQTLDLG